MPSAGPDLLPAATLNSGTAVGIAPPGAEGVGAPSSTGITASKLTGVEYSPILAPSSARARHQYLRPVGRVSGSCSVVMSGPGGTPTRLKTIELKLASLATSKVYVRGRTPE